MMYVLEADWQAAAADDEAQRAERSARFAHEAAALMHARMAEVERIKAGL